MKGCSDDINRSNKIGFWGGGEGVVSPPLALMLAAQSKDCSPRWFLTIPLHKTQAADLNHHSLSLRSHLSEKKTETTAAHRFVQKLVSL